MNKETKEAADQKLVQRVNRSIALCCIRDFGTISRTDIAKRTGLSKASVTDITTLFMEKGLVQEVQEGISNRGPKPIIFSAISHLNKYWENKSLWKVTQKN